ncbi:response regulator [soil metagenome]
MSKKILLVDDEKLARKSLANVLENPGLLVEQAANGKEGYEKALEWQPDLIVTDVHMPEMDGMQMIQKLRDHEAWGSKVPIVVLTVDEAPVYINQALEAGVTFYLSKNSISQEEIAEQIVIAAG